MSNAQKPVMPEMRQQIVDLKQHLEDVVDHLNNARQAVEYLLRNDLHEVWQEILCSRWKEDDERDFLD